MEQISVKEHPALQLLYDYPYRKYRLKIISRLQVILLLCNISLDQLFSRSRYADHLLARNLIMMELYLKTNLDWNDLNLLFRQRYKRPCYAWEWLERIFISPDPYYEPIRKIVNLYDPDFGEYFSDEVRDAFKTYKLQSAGIASFAKKMKAKQL